jgi:hypothetical protein
VRQGYYEYITSGRLFAQPGPTMKRFSMTFLLPAACFAALSSHPHAPASMDPGDGGLIADSAHRASNAGSVAAKPSRPERQIILNGFRMPSIGLEFRNRTVSWHAGMYCTVVSKDADGENETTWFAKAGATWWPLSYLFVDLSGLYGLNKDYRNDPALMLNPGLQYAFRETVLVRLGVALLASPEHSVKINPTPGIGLAFTL